MIKEVYDDIINLTLSIKSSIKKERNLLINNNLSINIVASNVQKIITEFKQYLEEYSCLKNNTIIDILNKYNDDLLHIINEDNKDNVLIISDNITDSLLDKVQENIIVKDDILSLTLIVKNEAFYIKEWIEFHRMIGVTHFYIYDNESSDDLYKKLSSYISQGIVTYTYWPTKGVYSTRLEAQLAAYNDSLYKYKYDTKYMGFIDVDEFIVPVNRKNIIEVIDDIFYRYENCGGIGINWRVYGSSYNEKKIDGLVVENYKYRAYDNYDLNKHIKTICNPRVTIAFNIEPHSAIYREPFYCVSENGKRIESCFFKNSTCNKIRINHYYIKSREDCIEKCRRKNGKQINEEYIQEFFTRIDKDCNKVYDPIMEKYIDELKKRCDLI